MLALDGYTAGSASATKLIAQNGLSGYGYGRDNSDGITCKNRYKAGGYFEGPKLTVSNIDMAKDVLGGYCGVAYAYKGHEPGNGGAGGAGGTIEISKTAKVYAYNGNLYTDGTSYESGKNQCPIYAQAGIKLAKYNTAYGNGTASGVWNAWKVTCTQKQSGISKSGYQNPNNTQVVSISSLLKVSNKLLDNVQMKYQGVGSGAGYTESSNGTCTYK